MSALGKRVLDLAEQQGLLDGQAITELRKKVAESKFVVTPEAIAKVLVDHGHLTPFQARKLVAQAQGDEALPSEQKVVERAKPKPKPRADEDLMLAEDAPAHRRPKANVSEEIVELEAVDPAESSPRTIGTPVNRGAADSAGATAEDFVDLEPVEPTPAARGQRWKTDPETLSETIEMEPLDAAEPASEVVELEPVEDLFGPDPFTAPVSPAPRSAKPPTAAKTVPAAPSASSDIFGEPVIPARAQAQTAKPAKPVRRTTKNVWDSPLLLIGGGTFGVVLVVFLLLLYALTRGSAAEMFAKAEEAYKSGSFTSAIAIYNQFLDKYPQDANASLARVRRGMATLRQISDDGKNPPLGLETAQKVLPQIESEEKFGEARAELASILPDIADGVTTRAVQATEPARKQEMVKLANDALSLVNNPAYLPSSVRKDRENHISRIVDKLKVAERGIEQDRQLAAAIENITAAAEKGQASDAYALRADLLRTYPGLESNPKLVAAVAKVGQRERELVKVTQGGPEPFKDDHPSPHSTVLLSTGAAAKSSSATPAIILVEGAVYGFDPSTGGILWRRHVGYETTVEPIALSFGSQRGAVLVDGRRQELVMVAAATGELKWRHMLGDGISGLAASGTRVYVTTQKGRITAIDAASGDIVGSALLPQGTVVGPALRQSRLFQVGEHSTLFVLDSDSLKCTQTVYLGHKAGSLLVPPTAILDLLLVIESPADDHSLVQVVSLDAKTKEWAATGQPRRLKGRVVNPPAVSGSRVAVATDLGQLAVYQAETSGVDRLRSLAGMAATESTPLVTYTELDNNRLFVAGRRRTMFEVQEALQQLALKWTENQDDRFAAPLALHGDVLVVARRRTGASGVQLEGCRAATGQVLWTTPLATPIAGLHGIAGQKVIALDGTGQLFELDGEAFKSGHSGKAFFDSNSGSLSEDSVASDGQVLTWKRPEGSRAYVYDPVAGSAINTISLPASGAAPALSLSGGIVAPLADGRIVWLSLSEPRREAAPFLPPLVPDALPLWTKPLPLPDGNSFLISDGRSAVYSVSREEGSQLRLVGKGHSETSGPVHSLAWVGTAAIGVMRLDTVDAVVGVDSQAKQTFEPVKLAGRVTAGPFAIGGLALLTAEPDGLLCFDAEGKLRWKQELTRGPLAGAPAALPDGDLLVAYQFGDICRLNAPTGEELACQPLHEPLRGPVCVLDTTAYVCGSDGVVHRIAVPPRQ